MMVAACLVCRLHVSRLKMPIIINPGRWD